MNPARSLAIGFAVAVTTLTAGHAQQRIDIQGPAQPAVAGKWPAPATGRAPWPTETWCENSRRTWHSKDAAALNEALGFSELLSGKEWTTKDHTLIFKPFRRTNPFATIAIFPLCYKKQKIVAQMLARRKMVPFLADRREYTTGFFFITKIRKLKSTYSITGYWFNRGHYYNKYERGPVVDPNKHFVSRRFQFEDGNQQQNRHDV